MYVRASVHPSVRACVAKTCTHRACEISDCPTLRPSLLAQWLSMVCANVKGICAAMDAHTYKRPHSHSHHTDHTRLRYNGYNGWNGTAVQPPSRPLCTDVPCVFNVTADPEERNDLAEDDPDVRDVLQCAIRVARLSHSPNHFFFPNARDW